jgi:KUP system potassium uptake protein
MTTTVLFFAIAHLRWHKPLRVVLPGLVSFLFIDLALFSANLPKVPTGGWFPLTIGLVLFTILTTWQKGRGIVTAKRTAAEGSLSDFIETLRTMDPPPFRTPGTAVALSAGKETTPLALRDNLRYDHVLHEHVVIVSVHTGTLPHVDPDEQISVDDLAYTDDDVEYVTISLGFQDRPDVPAALRRAAEAGMLGELGDVDLDNAVYLLSAVTLVIGEDPGLSRWRKRLFLLLAGTATSPVNSFHLPRERIVTMGSYIEL